MAVRFEWSGNNVIVRTVFGNYCGTVVQARDAYHDGDSVVVISNTGQQVVFSPNGIRRTR